MSASAVVVCQHHQCFRCSKTFKSCFLCQLDPQIVLVWSYKKRTRRRHQNVIFLHRHCSDSKPKAWQLLSGEMTAVGFEPMPLRTGALSQRLRPLGQTVLGQACVHVCCVRFASRRGARQCTRSHAQHMVPRGLEPRTLRLLAVRSNQLSYETVVLAAVCRMCLSAVVGGVIASLQCVTFRLVSTGAPVGTHHLVASCCARCLLGSVAFRSSPPSSAGRAQGP